MLAKIMLTLVCEKINYTSVFLDALEIKLVYFKLNLKVDKHMAKIWVASYISHA